MEEGEASEVKIDTVYTPSKCSSKTNALKSKLKAFDSNSDEEVRDLFLDGTGWVIKKNASYKYR